MVDSLGHRVPLGLTPERLVVEEPRGPTPVLVEADHNTVHGGCAWCLRRPREGSVCELYAPACVEHGPKERGDGLALRDRVGGDERELAGIAGLGEELERLRVPTGDVVEPSNVVAVPDESELVGLLGCPSCVTEERGVPEDVEVLRGRHDPRPVESQGALVRVDCVDLLQRQRVRADAECELHRLVGLMLDEVEGCGRDASRPFLDLDAVEVLETHREVSGIEEHPGCGLTATELL